MRAQLRRADRDIELDFEALANLCALVHRQLEALLIVQALQEARVHAGHTERLQRTTMVGRDEQKLGKLTNSSSSMSLILSISVFQLDGFGLLQWHVMVPRPIG